MRVVFTSWRDLAHPQAGGSELLVDHLACGLLERGHQVALMCGGPVGSRQYPVVDLGGTYGQYLRAPIEHRRRFADWDLLVDVENGLPYFSPLWRRGPSLCLMHHVHTDQWAGRFAPPVAATGRWAECWLMPKLYRHRPFIAVSPSTATALTEMGVPRDHVRWAPLNAVDAPTRVAPKTAEPQFVVVGRLVPHKRVDLVLELWPRVRRQTGGRLVVVGDGPERSRLESLAGEGVVFAGRVDEQAKWDLMASAWLLVTAAHHEGWGVAIIEAGAVGTPALGFDVPGVRDAIVDGASGVLAGTSDELVARWVEVAEDADRRARLGAGARKVADQFTWDRSVDLFEELALGVVSGAPFADAEAHADADAEAHADAGADALAGYEAGAAVEAGVDGGYSPVPSPTT